jgi:CheY-like chemotaxis protein
LTVAEGEVMPELPNGLRVLLVEDNPQVREFAEGLLADLGCEVVSTETGEEALDYLSGKKVDLVVTDVVMPGMSGVELARLIGQAHPDVPLLLATGYSDEIVKRGSEFVVLAKPFGAADLSRAMAAVLDGASRQPFVAARG